MKFIHALHPVSWNAGDPRSEFLTSLTMTCAVIDLTIIDMHLCYDPDVHNHMWAVFEVNDINNIQPCFHSVINSLTKDGVNVCITDQGIPSNFIETPRSKLLTKLI